MPRWLFFFENRPDIGLKVKVAFEDLAIFPENGLALLVQFAHIATVDLVKHLIDLMVQAMLEQGAKSNVKDISQGVGYFHQVSFLGSLEVLFIFFLEEVIAQGIVFLTDGGHAIGITDPEHFMELVHRHDLI